MKNLLEPGMKVMTAIFGEVTLLEVFRTEAEARAKGYRFDSGAYLLNDFGAREPVSWKVLARDTDFTHKVFCGVEESGQGTEVGGDPADVREDGGLDREAGRAQGVHEPI